MEAGGDFENCFYLSTAELVSLAGTHFSLELQSFSNSWSSFFRRCSGVIFLCGAGGLVLFFFSRRHRKTIYRSLVHIGQAFVDFLRGEELVEDIRDDHQYVYPRYFGPSLFKGSGYEADLESDSGEFPHVTEKLYEVNKKRRFSSNQRILRRSRSNKKMPIQSGPISNECDDKRRPLCGLSSFVPASNSTDEADVVEVITVLPPPDLATRGVPDGESLSEEDQAATTTPPSEVGKTQSQAMQEMVWQAKQVRKLIEDISLGSQESDFSLELYSSDFGPPVEPLFEIDHSRFIPDCNLPLQNNRTLMNSRCPSRETKPFIINPEVLSAEDPWEWDNEGLEDNVNGEQFLTETTLEENSCTFIRNVLPEISIYPPCSRLQPTGRSSSASP